MSDGRRNDYQGSPWNESYYSNAVRRIFFYIRAEHGRDRQPESFSVHYTDGPEGHSQIFDPRGEYTGTGTRVDPGANLLGPSFNALPRPTSYVDESSFQIREQDSVLALPQHVPPYDHISELSAMISGRLGENKLVEAHHELPGQCDAEAIRRPIISPKGYGQLPCITPTVLQGRIKTQFKAPTQKRRTHRANERCPVCLASLGRLKDRERHVLSHLPKWLHCPNPSCPWRGDRWEALNIHRRNAHPSNSQEQVKSDASSIIYDPWPLVKSIITNDISLEEARKRAVLMVEKRALELTKSGLWEDFWGRKRRRPRLAPDKNQRFIVF